jgi:uncharacterized protein YjdB
MLAVLLIPLLSCSTDAIPTSLAGPEQNRLVADVRIHPTEVLVEPDGTLQLSTAVYSAMGRQVNGRTAEWSSSDESVVTIDAAGRIIAVNEGSATVKAIVAGVVATATVDVRGEVVEIIIENQKDAVDAGASQQLSATLIYSNGARRPAGRLAWSTSDEKVAQVDADGWLTARQPGPVEIRAAGRNRKGKKWVQVEGSAVATIVVSPSATTLAIGTTERLWADIRDASGNRLYPTTAWSSSNPSVANVNKNGVVTAKAEGTATVTAMAGGMVGSTDVTVVASGNTGSPAPSMPAQVADLTVLSPSTNSMTLRFTEVDDGSGSPSAYMVRYQDGTTLDWAQATTVTKGSCASLTGSQIGASRTCTVEGLRESTGYQFQLVAYRGTLNVDAVFGALSNVTSGITLDLAMYVDVVPSAFQLDVGTAKQLSAVVTDAFGNVLDQGGQWTSSRSSIATVSASGNVAAIGVGDAQIRYSVSTMSGASDARVTQPPASDGSSSDDGSSGGTSGGSSGSGSSGSSGGSGSGNVQAGGNEPGLNRLFDSEFNSLSDMQAEGWGYNSPKCYSGGFCNPEVIDDTAFPNSPVAQNTYASGHALTGTGSVGSSGGTRLWWNDASVNEMYISWRYRLDPGWANSGTNMKMLGIRRPDGSGHKQFAWIRASGDGPNLRFDMNQKTERTGQVVASRILTPNRSGGTVRAGTVHFYEVYVKMNTPGVANGVVRMWLDGVLTAEYNDVMWVGDSSFPYRTFSGVKWDPIIGARTPAPEQWSRIDDLYVSGR